MKGILFVSHSYRIFFIINCYSHKTYKYYLTTTAREQYDRYYIFYIAFLTQPLTHLAFNLKFRTPGPNICSLVHYSSQNENNCTQIKALGLNCLRKLAEFRARVLLTLNANGDASSGLQGKTMAAPPLSIAHSQILPTTAGYRFELGTLYLNAISLDRNFHIRYNIFRSLF